MCFTLAGPQLHGRAFQGPLALPMRCSRVPGRRPNSHRELVSAKGTGLHRTFRALRPQLFCEGRMVLQARSCWIAVFPLQEANSRKATSSSTSCAVNTRARYRANPSANDSRRRACPGWEGETYVVSVQLGRTPSKSSRRSEDSCRAPDLDFAGSSTASRGTDVAVSSARHIRVELRHTVRFA